MAGKFRQQRQLNCLILNKQTQTTGQLSKKMQLVMAYDLKLAADCWLLEPTASWYRCCLTTLSSSRVSLPPASYSSLSLNLSLCFYQFWPPPSFNSPFVLSRQHHLSHTTHPHTTNANTDLQWISIVKCTTTVKYAAAPHTFRPLTLLYKLIQIFTYLLPVRYKLHIKSNTNW